MRTTTLGPARRAISVLGLGCMSMSHPGRDEEESLSVLRAALDAGITFLDTADKYGKGHNERLVGTAIAGRRDEVTVATKVGFVGSSRDAKPVDGSPDHIRRSCDASLERLGTDRIDLYYLHRVDPHVPIEESVGAMAALVEAGKVAQLGLSEVTVATLRRAWDVHPVAAVQSEYSIAAREVEEDVLPACRALGTTFVAYSPLGIGLLTGRVRTPDDLPPGNRLPKQSRMHDRHRAHNLRIVDELAAIAGDVGCTLPQLAIAWLLTRDVVPIPSSSRRSYLEDNLGALDVDLGEDVLARIDEVAPIGAFRGERKSSLGLRLVGR
ncbi:MAG: aldo/keto reductase [Actinobacteria bacterium]|nr:aldo/keto reductase [Actinomycetota bacterium]